MSNDNAGIAVLIIWLGTIAISIGTGILSYNWIEPESFWGVIGFLIVWSVVSRIAYTVVGGIVYMIFDR